MGFLSRGGGSSQVREKQRGAGCMAVAYAYVWLKYYSETPYIRKTTYKKTSTREIRRILENQYWP